MHEKIDQIQIALCLSNSCAMDPDRNQVESLTFDLVGFKLIFPNPESGSNRYRVPTVYENFHPKFIKLVADNVHILDLILSLAAL